MSRRILPRTKDQRGIRLRARPEHCGELHEAASAVPWRRPHSFAILQPTQKLKERVAERRRVTRANPGTPRLFERLLDDVV